MVPLFFPDRLFPQPLALPLLVPQPWVHADGVPDAVPGLPDGVPGLPANGLPDAARLPTASVPAASVPASSLPAHVSALASPCSLKSKKEK